MRGVRRRRRADPQPRGHHARRSIPPMLARAAEIVGRDRRLPDRPVQQHRHGRRLPGARRRSCSSSSTAGSTRSCVYVGDGGLLPRRRPGRCATRSPAIAPRRRRAGRVGGAVRRPARHPPDRGRRRRLRARRMLDARRASTRSSRCRPRTRSAMARRAAREEGVWSGPSSGANLDAALAARRAGSARATGSPRSRSTPGSSTCPASSTADRREPRRPGSARSTRSPTRPRAGRPDRGVVHRVLGHLLPVRRGLALDRDVLPGASSACRCWSLVASAERRRYGPLPREHVRLAAIAGIFFAGDLMFWHHAIEYVGAGLATVLGNLQVLIVGVVAWLRPRGAAVAGDAAGAAGRAGRRRPDLGRRRGRRVRRGPAARASSSGSRPRSATRPTCCSSGAAAATRADRPGRWRSRRSAPRSSRRGRAGRSATWT